MRNALEVEITSSLLMADTERTQDVMNGLRELSIHIANESGLLPAQDQP